MGVGVGGKGGGNTLKIVLVPVVRNQRHTREDWARVGPVWG